MECLVDFVVHKVCIEQHATLIHKAKTFLLIVENCMYRNLLHSHFHLPHKGLRCWPPCSAHQPPVFLFQLPFQPTGNVETRYLKDVLGKMDARTGTCSLLRPTYLTSTLGNGISSVQCTWIASAYCVADTTKIYLCDPEQSYGSHSPGNGYVVAQHIHMLMFCIRICSSMYYHGVCMKSNIRKAVKLGGCMLRFLWYIYANKSTSRSKYFQWGSRDTSACTRQSIGCVWPDTHTFTVTLLKWWN